jgi:hypothetical protein
MTLEEIYLGTGSRNELTYCIICSLLNFSTVNVILFNVILMQFNLLVLWRDTEVAENRILRLIPVLHNTLRQD